MQKSPTTPINKKNGGVVAKGANYKYKFFFKKSIFFLKKYLKNKNVDFLYTKCYIIIMNCCIFKGITTTLPYKTTYGVAINLLVDGKLTISLFTDKLDISNIRKSSIVLAIAKATSFVNVEYPLYECIDIAVSPEQTVTLLPLLMGVEDPYSELKKLDVETTIIGG